MAGPQRLIHCSLAGGWREAWALAVCSIHGKVRLEQGLGSNSLMEELGYDGCGKFRGPSNTGELGDPGQGTGGQPGAGQTVQLFSLGAPCTFSEGPRTPVPSPGCLIGCC